MAELDRFETRFAAAYRRYLDEAPTTVDAAAVARTVAAQPRTRIVVRRWAMLPVRGLAWVMLGALLLVVAGAAAVLVGSQRPALGFTCPPGTDPDAPGPAGQARPPLTTSPMAFDRRAGRIVMVVDTDSPVMRGTWTFDVCTNTWTLMQARRGPGATHDLVYDAGSDLTIAVDKQETWAYDLDADRWDRMSDAPSDLYSLVYDPVADRVLASERAWYPTGLWGYDVDTDEWTHVPQVDPPPSVILAAYDTSVDRVIAVRPAVSPDKSTWLLDPRSGSWSEAGTWQGEPINTYLGMASGRLVAYADSLDRTVQVDGGRVVTYDASADRWDTLDEARFGPMNRFNAAVVYDPVNERLVMYGGAYQASDSSTDVVQSDDVLAFDLATHEWTVLLEAANVLVEAVP